jgi:hypothetical protein
MVETVVMEQHLLLADQVLPTLAVAAVLHLAPELLELAVLAVAVQVVNLALQMERLVQQI